MEKIIKCSSILQDTIEEGHDPYIFIKTKYPKVDEFLKWRFCETKLEYLDICYWLDDTKGIKKACKGINEEELIKFLETKNDDYRRDVIFELKIKDWKLVSSICGNYSEDPKENVISFLCEEELEWNTKVVADYCKS